MAENNTATEYVVYAYKFFYTWVDGLINALTNIPEFNRLMPNDFVERMQRACTGLSYTNYWGETNDNADKLAFRLNDLLFSHNVTAKVASYTVKNKRCCMVLTATSGEEIKIIPNDDKWSRDVLGDLLFTTSSTSLISGWSTKEPDPEP